MKKEPTGLMALPEVINNKVIQDIKAQEGALAKQIAEQSKKLGEKHPQMVRLNNEMDTLKRQEGQEVDLIVSSLKNDYDEAKRSEGSLRSALNRQKSEAMATRSARPNTNLKDRMSTAHAKFTTRYLKSSRNPILWVLSSQQR